MKIHKWDNFIRGWFIGDFPLALKRTKDFEVAVKYYKKGDKEDAHIHKVAEEITLVVYGKCRMNDQILKKGDIAVVPPNESAEFEALENSSNVIVKIPSVIGDKYVVESGTSK